jgi:hypothetical protein
MVEAGWTDVVRLPGFWFACSVIFLANGLIALFANFWSLGVFEVVTALLAAASAVGMLRMRRRRGGARSGDPGAGRLVDQRKGSED